MDLRERLRGGIPLDDGRRAALLGFLPEYLHDQRWFAGKGRAIAGIDVSDELAWSDGVVLLLAEVRYADGGHDPYLITAHLDGDRLAEPLADPALGRAFREIIGQGLRIPMRRGTLVGRPTSRFAEIAGSDVDDLAVRLASVEQSNTNVLFGDRLLLKFLRRPAPGPNPEVEMGAFLTEQGGERITPLLAGSLGYEGPSGEIADLGVLSEFIPNEGSGWDRSLDRLRGWLSRVEDREIPQDPSTLLADPDCRVLLGPSLADAKILGRATARLHRALASRPDRPDFAPEPLDDADWAAMKAQVRGQWDRVGAAIGPTGVAVEEAISRQFADWDRAGNPAPGSCRIRCHGDYHLGQTLMVPGDAVILDFEGEPGVPLERRRAKQSPYRDVAGMLRSFSYAAGMVAREAGPGSIPKARAWRSLVTGAFLESYDEGTRDAPFFHANRRELIGLFWLEKAIYEVAYELANRPDWVGIPLGDLEEWAGAKSKTGRG